MHLIALRSALIMFIFEWYQHIYVEGVVIKEWLVFNSSTSAILHDLLIYDVMQGVVTRL